MKKRVAFFPNHPSQIWLLHAVAKELEPAAEVVWILRDKDVALGVADALGLKYTVVSKAARGLLGNARELFFNIFRCRRLTHELGIDLWVTKYGCGNIGARLAGKPSIAFNDDDTDVVPLIAWTSYPFAKLVLAPDVVRMGRFAHKSRRYAGCHELSYLHPKRFTPRDDIHSALGLSKDEKFAIIRLSALQAHHDKGIKGVSKELLRAVIRMTAGRCRIFISSEKELDAEFESLRYPAPVQGIHSALAHAEFFLGDSQTMTTEAAVLGVPAFRISDFVDRISVIADVESYGLAFGFKPDRAEDALAKLSDVLAMPDRAEVFARRRDRFLAEKADPVPFFSEAIARSLEAR